MRTRFGSSWSRSAVRAALRASPEQQMHRAPEPWRFASEIVYSEIDLWMSISLGVSLQHARLPCWRVELRTRRSTRQTRIRVASHAHPFSLAISSTPIQGRARDAVVGYGRGSSPCEVNGSPASAAAVAGAKPDSSGIPRWVRWPGEMSREAPSAKTPKSPGRHWVGPGVAAVRRNSAPGCGRSQLRDVWDHQRRKERQGLSGFGQPVAHHSGCSALLLYVERGRLYADEHHLTPDAGRHPVSRLRGTLLQASKRGMTLRPTDQ